MNISDQIEYRQVVGSGDTVIHAFHSNKNVNTHDPFIVSGDTGIQNFEMPLYISYGGTMDYYGQDPYSVFTNLNVPFIRFVFTANTESISGATDFVHKVYKIDYNTYKKYNPQFSQAVSQKQNQENTISEVTVQNVDGVQTRTKKTITTNNSTSTDNFLNNDFTTFDQIKNLAENPYYEITENATGVTLPTFDLIFGQYIKTSRTTAGDYKQKLFEDKSQYFVKSSFRFEQPTSPFDSDQIKIFSGNDFSDLIIKDTQFYPSYFNGFIYNQTIISGSTFFSTYPLFSSSTYEDSIYSDHKINQGTFSGITVGGSFFTFFDVPNKPAFENPILSGPQTTFSPKVYFSNVQDGDKYTVEVTYDLTDTGFTNNKQVFNVEKNLSENNIQEAIFSIKTNSDFRYRVGNVKSLRNIFDVDQTIVTFSDQFTGSTQVQPPDLYIFSESDSPFNVAIAPLIPPPNIVNQNPGNYTLSGSASGSTVSGATITLFNPTTNITITSTTDSFGSFVISGLTQNANYTLTTSWRGYETRVQTLNIGSNLNIGYHIQILWSNQYETWQIKANDRMGFDNTVYFS